MNIEKLNKDKSIIRLISHLGNRFGFGNFIINDFWDSDRCAIGLSDNQKEALIYISAYGEREGQYYISIEDINDPTISNGESENVEIKEFELKVAEFLKLK